MLLNVEIIPLSNHKERIGLTRAFELERKRRGKLGKRDRMCVENDYIYIERFEARSNIH